MQRLNNLTVVVLAALTLAVLPLAGCVTKSKADAMVRAAYVAGEKHGAMMQKEARVVWVVGNVQQPLVPWTEDLTLAKAIVAANYLGARDPRLIQIFRNGEPPIQVSSQQILNGYDLPLSPGDRIEIHP